MSSKESTYQGWTNYPTWAVNLWLANDEGLYNLVRDEARTAIETASDNNNVPNICTEHDAAVFELADWLKGLTDDPDIGLVPELEGFAADLMNYALGEVDWEEIATHWIDDQS